MEAARLCKMRGHDVTRSMKRAANGRRIYCRGRARFQGKDKQLIKWYISSCAISASRSSGIRNHKEQLDRLDADEIIVATGSVPKNCRSPAFAPQYHGSDGIPAYKKQAGDNVVIIGGGLTGCEIAYDLSRKGKKGGHRGNAGRHFEVMG